ncbi:MAG TPA: sigma-70 family RNA polymerase sigma factor [Polyangia bacterium]|nr:sigma-70 family RNA polymerase sigma factor [Polyangia bacterium]
MGEAQQGGVKAQEALVRKYGAMVNRLAFRLLGGSEDLDDLVQESFLQAFRSLKRLDKPEAFRGWLSEIVVRTAHNLIRRRRLMSRIGLRTTRPIDVDGLITPNTPLESMLTLTSIYRTLERLPAKVRIALVLRRVEGRQLEEVAELMGASLASVKRWLAQADKVLEGERRTVGSQT